MNVNSPLNCRKGQSKRRGKSLVRKKKVQGRVKVALSFLNLF